jgi:hypothetical protein
MRMTMVYAKIANRTVADEYFAVSEKVEALYDAPKELPATAESAEMRKLRAEMHRRMLGNGYCARGLDCHFESICESCPTSRPHSSSDPHSNASATTPPARDRSGGRRSSTGCLRDSTLKPHDPAPSRVTEAHQARC